MKLRDISRRSIVNIIEKVYFVNVMEETLPEPSAPSCLKCKDTNVVEGYPNPLCAPCRESLIKFPIPIWVKVFGGVVLAVMLISLIGFPKQMSTGIHLKRAKNAMAAKNFQTAQNELLLVKEAVPNSLETRANLLMASFYNMDLSTLLGEVDYLQNKPFEDEALLRDVEITMDKARDYLPSDSFSVFTGMPQYADSLPTADLLAFVKRQPEDIYAKTVYMQRLYDAGDDRTDSVLAEILRMDPDYVSAQIIQIMQFRGAGQLDSALMVCNSILKQNHEMILVLSLKARILLSQGKNEQGLKYARKVVEMDKQDPYAQATLALAYHVSKDFKNRDRVLLQASKDSVAAEYMQYVRDVISGKEKFPQ